MGSKHPSPSPWKKTFIGWLLILLALPLAYATFTRCVDKLSSESWPAARAEVLTLDVSKRVRSGAWCVELRYQYLIDEKIFASSRWSLSTRVACYRDRQVADALARRFQPGADIGIRYDPSDPGTSIVHFDDVGVSDFIFLMLAAVFLAAGIALVKGARSRNAPQYANEEHQR